MRIPTLPAAFALLLVLCLASVATATTGAGATGGSADDFRVTFVATLTGSDSRDYVGLGVAPTSTDAYDSGTDKPEPPAPPTDAWVQAYVYDAGASSSALRRLNFSLLAPQAERDWVVRVDVRTPDAANVVLEWSAAEAAVVGDATLRLLDGNQTVDLKTQTSYTVAVPAGVSTYELTVQLRPAATEATPADGGSTGETGGTGGTSSGSTGGSSGGDTSTGGSTGGDTSSSGSTTGDGTGANTGTGTDSSGNATDDGDGASATPGNETSTTGSGSSGADGASAEADTAPGGGNDSGETPGESSTEGETDGSTDTSDDGSTSTTPTGPTTPSTPTAPTTPTTGDADTQSGTTPAASTDNKRGRIPGFEAAFLGIAFIAAAALGARRERRE